MSHYTQTPNSIKNHAKGETWTHNSRLGVLRLNKSHTRLDRIILIIPQSPVVLNNKIIIFFSVLSTSYNSSWIIHSNISIKTRSPLLSLSTLAIHNSCFLNLNNTRKRRVHSLTHNGFLQLKYNRCWGHQLINKDLTEPGDRAPRGAPDLPNWKGGHPRDFNRMERPRGQYDPHPITQRGTTIMQASTECHPQ